MTKGVKWVSKKSKKQYGYSVGVLKYARQDKQKEAWDRKKNRFGLTEISGQWIGQNFDLDLLKNNLLFALSN